MSNSALLKSSIAKKYWMALTGLFLCTFLVGHLLGNLQLIMKTGEEGRRAFNEYAYFMGHNIFIKILSYVTYVSIIFHAVDGIMLTIQNKKARPVNYAYSNPSANSSLPSRWMAVLGTLILVFISTHMANFWWKMKITEEVPLHNKMITRTQKQQNPMTGEPMVTSFKINYMYTTKGEYVPYSFKEPNQNIYFNPQTGQPLSGKDTALYNVKELTFFYDKTTELPVAEGYKDLHTVVIQFFSKSNNFALFGVLFYTLSMLVLGFHLWHGFASAFQSLGVNHPKWNPLIKGLGKGFAVIVPALFAIIPILIYLKS